MRDVPVQTDAAARFAPRSVGQTAEGFGLEAPFVAHVSISAEVTM